MLDDSGEFGVIVFSFGSLVALNTLPEDTLDVLKSVFSQLPQTVIWKYENDHMADKPDNVVLCKWLPQRAILRKSHFRLFEVNNDGPLTNRVSCGHTVPR